MLLKFYKRLLLTLIVCSISISAFAFSVAAYGSDNDIAYSLDAPSNPNYSYTSAEYRGNSGINVPWKVNFTYSQEGNGTVMQYFLSGPWWTKQSDRKNVKQGSGAKYYHAYDTAKNMNVALAASNNNITENKYRISGLWDEESAKHTFNDYN